MALKRLVLVLCLAGCGAEHQSVRDIAVDVSFDRDSANYGVVRVTGTRDTTRFAVFVSLDSATSATPRLGGSWERGGNTLRFVPSFRPSPGTTMWVHLRVGESGPSERVWRFPVPEEADSSSVPRIVAVHPSMDSLPENTLRWYLEFSRPMRSGHALANVLLIDEQGHVDRTAFLDTSEELWDPTLTRLTLLFDPGRVKRGIRTNLEQGRPLKAGQRYTLVIEPGWPDLRGVLLQERFEKQFVATAADHSGPDPRSWVVRAPDLNTRDPVILSFDDPVDHALGARLIGVTNGNGNRINGRAELGHQDREWRFVPSEPWRSGTYHLQIGQELEDVAGNRPGLAFDHEARAAVGSSQSRTMLTRAFEVARLR